MCGIFGCFSKRREVRAEWISDALDEMQHRGPDGRGIWISPDRSVGLGHVRLALVGVESGAQPIRGENGSVRVVVNGEFYGHEEARRELERIGHVFSTRTDSEIAVHLYEDLGTKFVERLRGEFALILWDQAEDLLVAIRDRFGIKPLYYAEHEGRLLFASEVKGLLAAEVPAVWDREAVFQHLHMCLPNNRTVFKGVRQVPPGHMLLARGERWSVEKYWDMEYPDCDWDSQITEGEAIEVLRAQLWEATALRLQADVPVGIYLSGGIDSCGLLGVAAAIGGNPQQAFTVRFAEDGFDEGELAALAARHVGATHHILEVRERDRADFFRESLWHSELPTGGSNLVGKYLLSRLVRSKGMKAVITGEGADEIFAGYSYFVEDAGYAIPKLESEEGLANAEASEPESARRDLGDATASQPSVAERQLVRIPASLRRVASRAMLVAPFLRSGFGDEFSGVNPIAELLEGFDLGRVGRWDQLNQSLYICARTSLATNLLNRLGDRSEMAHSIEGRTPFLDHRLVEAANRFPVQLKVNGRCQKYILREAVRPLVPDESYRKEKHPFWASCDISGTFGDMVADTLHGRELDALPFFEPNLVRRALAEVRVAGEDRSSREGSFLTHVSSLCHLQSLFGLGG